MIAEILDDEKYSLLEADFRQFYGQSFKRALFGGDSGFSPREVINLISKLPREARYIQLIGGDKLVLDQKEQFLLDVIELLQGIRHFAPYSALSNLDKQARREVLKKIPKPIPRPGDAPTEPPKFASKDELKRIFGGFGKPSGRR